MNRSSGAALKVGDRVEILNCDALAPEISRKEAKAAQEKLAREKEEKEKADNSEKERLSKEQLKQKEVTENSEKSEHEDTLASPDTRVAAQRESEASMLKVEDGSRHEASKDSISVQDKENLSVGKDRKEENLRLPSHSTPRRDSKQNERDSSPSSARHSTSSQSFDQPSPSSPSFSASSETKSELTQYEGLVCWSGTIDNQDWLGVVMDKPVGKSNGVLNGVQYFWCKDKTGVFVRAADIKKIQNKKGDRTDTKELLDKRCKLIKELYETEKSYVETITKLSELVIKPLRLQINSPSLNLAKIPEVAVYFDNAEQILTLNTELIKEINERVKAWKEDPLNGKDGFVREPLAALFCRFAPLFELYSRYASNHGEGIKHIANFRPRPQFQSFLADCQKACNGMSIESLLITPVQRVPRYSMLLKEIGDTMSASHPDAGELWHAFYGVNLSATAINETIRHEEDAEKLMAIQRRFHGAAKDFIKPRTRFVKDAHVHKKTKRSHLWVKYYLLLLNDAVVYGKVAGKGYELRGVLPLPTVSAKAKAGNEFELVTGSKTLTIKLDTPEERNAWVNEINARVKEDASRAVDSTEDEQAVPLPWHKTNNQWEGGKKNKRFAVADDIATGETRYVKSLEQLLTLYIRPIVIYAKTHAQRESIGAVLHVFCNSIEQLYTLNGKLLRDLTERLLTWTHQSHLGDIFTQFGPLFKLYSQFANNHGGAVAVLHGPMFSGFVHDLEKGQKQTLASLLVLPMDRVAQYETLLRELNKHTQKLHTDYEPLQNALGAVSEALVHIASAKETSEEMNALQNLEARFVGGLTLVATDRVLLREGELSKVYRMHSKDFTVLLFSDLLLYADKTKDGRLKCHRQISLNAQVKLLSGPKKGQFSLLMGNKGLILMAKDDTLTKSWSESIQEVLTALEQGKKLKPPKADSKEDTSASESDVVPNELPMPKISRSATASAPNRSRTVSTGFRSSQDKAPELSEPVLRPRSSSTGPSLSIEPALTVNTATTEQTAESSLPLLLSPGSVGSPSSFSRLLKRVGSVLSPHSTSAQPSEVTSSPATQAKATTTASTATTTASTSTAMTLPEAISTAAPVTLTSAVSAPTTSNSIPITAEAATVSTSATLNSDLDAGAKTPDLNTMITETNAPSSSDDF